MPGIQYEQINMYKQMKSQRSEESLDRKGFDSHQIHKRMFQKTQAEAAQEEVSNNKSRNLNKILMSRSGDKINHESNMSNMVGSDRNYKQFLLMADNKKMVSQSIEDSYFFPHESGNLTTDGKPISNAYNASNVSKLQKAKISNDHNSSTLQKHQSTRVQSENSFHKNIGSLNKTVIDSKIHKNESAS